MVSEVFSAIDNLEKKVNGDFHEVVKKEIVERVEKGKEGVDIITMDVSKDPWKADSSLEMILISLCASLNMKPK